MWWAKKIYQRQTSFYLVIKNDVVQLFVVESTCRDVVFLFSKSKRSKEENNKRQRLNSQSFLFCRLLFSESFFFIAPLFSVGDRFFYLFIWRVKFPAFLSSTISLVPSVERKILFIMNELLFVVLTFYYHRPSRTPIVDGLLFRCHNLAFHFFFRPPSHCSVQRGPPSERSLAHLPNMITGVLV
jgi:hypothetical protein